jgi:hypothetical protein
MQRAIKGETLDGNYRVHWAKIWRLEQWIQQNYQNFTSVRLMGDLSPLDLNAEAADLAQDDEYLF